MSLSLTHTPGQESARVRELLVEAEGLRARPRERARGREGERGRKRERERAEDRERESEGEINP
jgi:hypothetical protein